MWGQLRALLSSSNRAQSKSQKSNQCQDVDLTSTIVPACLPSTNSQKYTGWQALVSGSIAIIFHHGWSQSSPSLPSGKPSICPFSHFPACHFPGWGTTSSGGATSDVLKETSREDHQHQNYQISKQKNIIKVQLSTRPNSGEVWMWSEFILKVKQFSPTLLQNVSRCLNQYLSPNFCKKHISEPFLKEMQKTFLLSDQFFWAQGAGGPGSTAVVPGTKLCAYKVTLLSYNHHHRLQHPLPIVNISTKTSWEYDWWECAG